MALPNTPLPQRPGRAPSGSLEEEGDKIITALEELLTRWH